MTVRLFGFGNTMNGAKAFALAMVALGAFAIADAAYARNVSYDKGMKEMENCAGASDATIGEGAGNLSCCSKSLNICVYCPLINSPGEAQTADDCLIIAYPPFRKRHGVKMPTLGSGGSSADPGNDRPPKAEDGNGNGGTVNPGGGNSPGADGGGNMNPGGGSMNGNTGNGGIN